MSSYSFFFITICLLVCLVCFIKIYRIVRRHQLQIHVQQQAVENSTDTNNHHIRQSTRSAKNVFIYFLAMILCYSPILIVVIISGFTSVDLKVKQTFPVTRAFMKSSINIFLYCWCMTELRTAVFKTAEFFFLVDKRMKELMNYQVIVWTDFSRKSTKPKKREGREMWWIIVPLDNKGESGFWKGESNKWIFCFIII